MKIDQYFSDSDRKKIESAVKKAEESVSGEIVPVFVGHCDAYEFVYYRMAIVAAIVTFCLLVLIDRFVPSIAIYDPLAYFFLVTLAAVVTMGVVHFVKFFKRILIGKTCLFDRAFMKANRYFLQEEVFNTVQRTGIMVFVAFFEHQVIVMADKGISAVVEQEKWDEVVAIVIASIKKGDTTDGIVKGIERCAEILQEHQLLITADDNNELSDKLRIE